MLVTCLIILIAHFPVGLRQMQQKLKLVDCVIEVHDARVSFRVCFQTCDDDDKLYIVSPWP
jgi:hypothetical protein